MTKDMRNGLALMCLAALLGMAWLVAYTADGSVADSLASSFGLLAVVAAAWGVITIGLGLRRP
jgi:hypothetical protein